MRWDEWLRDRIAGQDGMPDNIKLADEMFAMIRVAETAGVDLPNMSKFLQEHMRSGHKKRNGPRSLEPEEIVLRAKCIASVLELLESGVDVEDARTDVARQRNWIATKSSAGIRIMSHPIRPAHGTS